MPQEPEQGILVLKLKVSSRTRTEDNIRKFNSNLMSCLDRQVRYVLLQLHRDLRSAEAPNMRHKCM